MLVVIGLQCISLLLVGVIGAIKGAILPAEQYVNQAGISANIVLVGNGAILLGIFNLIFFPRYFKAPDKIGVPFVIGGNRRILNDRRFYCFTLGDTAVFYYAERT